MRCQVYFILLLAIILCTFDYINAARKDEQDVGKLKKDSQARKHHHHSSRFKGLSFLIGLLGVIFAGIGIYYIFLCYPILCRRERNYDFVEHSREDTTPTPSIEKTP